MTGRWRERLGANGAIAKRVESGWGLREAVWGGVRTHPEEGWAHHPVPAKAWRLEGCGAVSPNAGGRAALLWDG